MQVRLSKKFTLQGADWLRALLMAVLTPALVIIQQTVEAGQLKFNWTAIAMASIAGGVAYLLKNFAFEPAKVITTADTNLKAENAQDKIKEAL